MLWIKENTPLKRGGLPQFALIVRGISTSKVYSGSKRKSILGINKNTSLGRSLEKC
jgi:hypothetical protein